LDCVVFEARVAIFTLTQHTKTVKNIPNDHKIYQTAIKYIKWPENIPNGHNIYQHLTFQLPPKFWILGLKTYHLATLTVWTVSSSKLALRSEVFMSVIYVDFRQFLAEKLVIFLENQCYVGLIFLINQVAVFSEKKTPFFSPNKLFGDNIFQIITSVQDMRPDFTTRVCSYLGVKSGSLGVNLAPRGEL
jgi:hypothetical protein